MKTLTKITNIERAFYELAKTDPKAQEYFFTYYSQKLILLNHFYPHVEGIIKGFTDHGPEHIYRIMNIHEKFLKKSIPALSDSEVVKDNSLNLYELYLLLCASLWHDVGNLLGRDQHNKKVVDIANRLENSFFIDDYMKKYTLQIAQAHSGDDAVRKEIPVEDTDYMNEEINLRFLGATLRLADELDEGEVRVDEHYYNAMRDQIEPINRIYWETPCCIKRIEPRADDCLIEIHAKVKSADLYKMFPKNGREVALIDELIYRIDKMNKERMYYMQFVRKHVEYTKIVFDLWVENSKPLQHTFKFTNDQGYFDFWKEYPQINPQLQMPAYTLQRTEVQ
jgi:metal-dependent HD superfamily phosphatase/phosphodiesterase